MGGIVGTAVALVRRLGQRESPKRGGALVAVENDQGAAVESTGADEPDIGTMVAEFRQQLVALLIIPNRTQRASAS